MWIAFFIVAAFATQYNLYFAGFLFGLSALLYTTGRYYGDSDDDDNDNDKHEFAVQKYRDGYSDGHRDGSELKKCPCCNYSKCDHNHTST
jgi:hypothetical protein